MPRRGRALDKEHGFFNNSDRFLIALEARTGRARWEKKLDVGHAIVARGILYVDEGDDVLRTLDPATGEGN